MTIILERPPEQLSTSELTSQPADIPTNTLELVCYPLHPFDENPTELGLLLKEYPSEQTIAVRNLVANLTIEFHDRAVQQVAELRSQRTMDIRVGVPRAAIVPNIIGQEIMSSLGITRKLLGLELENSTTDTSRVYIISRTDRIS